MLCIAFIFWHSIIVRKREKYGEKRRLEVHSIDKYMSIARKYFSKLEETSYNITRRVFLSTDDKNVFRIIRKKYRSPRWEILGFQRKTEFEDILKDIYMLSECSFVVCSFSVDVRNLSCFDNLIIGPHYMMRTPV